MSRRLFQIFQRQLHLHLNSSSYNKKPNEEKLFHFFGKLIPNHNDFRAYAFVCQFCFVSTKKYFKKKIIALIIILGMKNLPWKQFPKNQTEPYMEIRKRLTGIRGTLWRQRRRGAWKTGKALSARRKLNTEYKLGPVLLKRKQLGLIATIQPDPCQMLRPIYIEMDSKPIGQHILKFWAQSLNSWPEFNFLVGWT